MQSRNVAYLEKLDHLRFYAATLVLLYHTNVDVWPITAQPWFKIPLIEHGHTGVPLFMVISGMILTIIANDKEIDTGRFYWNRFLRIYPLYVFIVSLGYFASPSQTHASIGLDYLLALFRYRTSIATSMSNSEASFGRWLSNYSSMLSSRSC